MRKEEVEIYSDASGQPVIRHPGRNFPGSLIQGDALYSLCQKADMACAAAKPTLNAEAYEELNALRNALWTRLNHYKSVLGEHGIRLPFIETP